MMLPIKYETVVKPQIVTKVESARAYRASEKGKITDRKYKHNNSKWQTDTAYLKREFLAWDGEGITKEDGSHLYVMLANSEGGYLADPAGLSTKACFDFLLSEAAKYPGRINVIYGGGYDFNCWMADLSRENLLGIYQNKRWTIAPYAVSWQRGKAFELSDALTKVRIYDVVSFFQCAFVKACDEYLGDSFYQREIIVSNKALRSSFTVDDIPSVKLYNEYELINLVSLMTELRARLNKIGLRPKRWDGPGAIAAALLSREGIKDAKKTSPESVASAGRYAYAGGRFEVARYGHVDSPAFEYDVNSAYPSALRLVPNLQRGRWKHHDSDPGNIPYALYRVHYFNGPEALPGPLFSRGKNGTICYPREVTGWYWSPEMATAREYVQQYRGTLEVLECWEYIEDDPTDRPFHFIGALYTKRQALKKAGDGAQVGVKLALNSLYGKLAQQVGWQPAGNGKPLRIPPYHQLEWAGYVTSSCRATVLRAAMLDLSSVIAFETDALFTSRPLDLDIGSELGQFDVTNFANLTYVQSGIYFGDLVDGGTVTKTRGVDRGTLTRDQVIKALAEPAAADRFVTAQLTRFIGAGVALVQNFDKWRRWETLPKRLSLEPMGKRAHYGCNGCDPDGEGITLGVWHETVCPFVQPQISCEFPIEWVNPDAAMVMLSELREGDKDYE